MGGGQGQAGEQGLAVKWWWVISVSIQTGGQITSAKWVPAKARPAAPNPSNGGTGLGQQRMGEGARGFQEEESIGVTPAVCG